MDSLTSQIQPDRLPQHIAIIMDGNGRWAKSSGKNRIFGHKNGVEAVRKTTEMCAKLGIPYLTLYAFSTENWNRPSLEVRALMQLLVQAIQKETATLQKNNIRLNAIGDLNQLPSSTRKSLEKAIAETAGNTRMTLTLALSYSSRWEITEAVKSILYEYKNNPFPIDSVNDQFISQFLETASMPDPDLLIRTSGEFRISNFLLWQLAYSELYFSSKLWPEFGEEDLVEAILDYQKRERRFGKTSEQLKP